MGPKVETEACVCFGFSQMNVQTDLNLRSSEIYVAKEGQLTEYTDDVAAGACASLSNESRLTQVAEAIT